MAKTWNILRTVGGSSTTIATVHELEYHGEWMAEEYVSITVKSPVPVDFHYGDYLTYRGIKFEINYDPNFIKKARSSTYGEGFTYENIKLYSVAARLQHIGFKDVVLNTLKDNANKLVYSSLGTFSFFAGSVEDLADRIQANLNRDNGTLWKVFTPDKTRTYQRIDSHVPSTVWDNYYDGTEERGKTEIDIRVADLSCRDALSLCYTSFGLSYYVVGTLIIIGGKPLSVGYDYEYGKGNGLYEVERVHDESQRIVTKLFAYGSERNIPMNYYAMLHKIAYANVVRDTYLITRSDGDPLLCVKTDMSYRQAINKCTGDGAVKLKYGNLTCDGQVFETNGEAWIELIPRRSPVANTFWNALGEGTVKIYLTTGVNINTWPTVENKSESSPNYPALLSINRLMLPGFPDMSLYDWVVSNGGAAVDSSVGKATWKGYTAYFSLDKDDPWIKSVHVEQYGVREGTANFDSNENEIYPTIEGTGYDEVSWCQQIEDNGYLDGDDATFEFMPMAVNGNDGGIEWNYSGETVTISMKDGYCVGREFTVKKAELNDNKDWVLTLERKKDDSLGIYFPYKHGDSNLYQIWGRGNHQGQSEGDHFVVTGIPLPQSYVEIAAEKLLEESLKHLATVDHPLYTYVPKIDDIEMARQHDKAMASQGSITSVHDTISAGMQMRIDDDDLNIHYRPFIDVLTIKENGNNGIPTYDVTLRSEKQMTTLERIQSEINGNRDSMIGLLNDGIGNNEFLSKINDDTAKGFIRFMKGLQVGERFVTGLLGEGGVFRTEEDGTTYIEADKLYIRMKAYFDSVEIRDYKHSAGNRIQSPAGARCCSVEWIDQDGNTLRQTSENLADTVLFRCYFRGSDGEDEVRNNFVVGDQAFCHVTTVETADDSPEAKGLNAKHYWRLVVGRNPHGTLTDNGEHWIDLSNRATETLTIDGTLYTHAGYQSGSDIPVAQDDIIQLGNINDKDRQGAIIEFVTGADAPSYQIFQGINDFSLNGKNYIGLGYSTQTGRAYLNVYGDAYIGDPNGSTYLRYDAGNRTLDIKAVINAQSTIDGKTIAEFIAQNTWTEEQITDMITDETDPLFADIDTALATLQNQVDGSIETWFYNGEPSSSTLPESEWKAKDQAAGNNNERLKHLGDLYYDNQTGYAYRYTNQGTEKVPQFVWNPISDSAVVKALADAAKAQDTADNKRRVFVNQPVPPYDEGDLWSNATFPTGNTITDAATNKYHNDVLRCRTSKESGQSFSILDWTLASKYTDDSALTSFINSTYANDKLNLQNQIDGKAETWYQAADPSQSWTTAEQKASHEGDLWYDTDTGETFYYDGTKWKKQDIPAEVFDTIDGKASIYTSKPTSYKKNDIWILEANYKLSGIDYQKGELVTATQDSDSFNAAHWTKKVKYTDDAALNEFKANQYVTLLTNGTISSNITNAQNTANAAQQAADDAQADADAAAAAASNAQADADAANNRLDGWADDGVISPTEKTSLKLEWENVKKEYAQICNDADKYGVTKTAFDSAYTSANSAFQKYTATTPENITIGADYANIAAYYAARQTILDAITQAAKKVATDAQAKADSAYALAGQAEAHAATMDAVKQALNQGTLIDGGLVLSTFIGLRDENSKIWSGISGAYNKNLTTGGIAAWFGGPMVDKEVVPSAEEYARSLFRFDGSGYVANGDISWDYTGLKKVTASKISALEMDLGGDAVATQKWVGQNYISVAFFDRLFRAYNGDTLVNANDTTSTIDNIKAMFGFWTQQYISALGNGGSGSGGGSTVSLNQPLSAINTAGLSAPTRSGSALVYYNGAWRYSTESTITASSLSVSNSLSAYTISAGSYITAAGNITSLAGGFVVSGKDNTYVLLAGGGTKLLSEIGGGDGTVTGIKIGTAATQYSPDADGVVTIPAYPSTSGFITGISINDGNPKTPSSGIVSLGGVAVTVKVGSTAYNVSSAGVISLPAYPTTLPASDVSAWAKASTKPSYTLDEISDGSTRKLTNYVTLATAQTISGNKIFHGLAIFNSYVGGGYNEGIRCNLSSTAENAWSSMILGGAYDSTYGTGEGVWTLCTNSKNFYFGHNGSSSATYGLSWGYTGGLNFKTSTLTNNNNTIWHAGNDGSGSGLDADLLDGQHGSYYATASALSGYLPLTGGVLSSSNNVLTVRSATDNSWIYFQSTINNTVEKRASSGYYSNFAFIANEASYARIGVADDGTPQYWTNAAGNAKYTLIHSGNIGSYNAGSATKLQTARSLWGNSFNGSGDLSGSLHIFSTVLGGWTEGIRMHVASNNWCGVIMCGSDNTGTTGTSAKTWGLFNNDGNFYINKNGSSNHTGYELCNISGNWGFGTTSPTYKLHVAGTFYANGNSSVGGTLDVTGATTLESTLSIGGTANTQSIVPVATATYDLGSTSKYWKYSYINRIYLASGVYLEYDSANGGIHVVGAGLYSDTYISAKGAGSGGSGSGGIDQDTADARYLRLTGGTINGNVSISSVLTSTTVKGSAAVIAGSYLTVGSSSVNQSYNMYVNGTSRLANLVVANGTQSTVNCVTLTTQSSYGIYINTGNAPAYTKVSWSTVSDIRRKNIVRNVGASIEQIASAPVFDFKWIDDGVSGRQMLGTSAQYWQSVFPCAVSDFGILSLDYGATALAAAVLTARKVQDHEERILELERENERLRKELEELKAA